MTTRFLLCGALCTLAATAQPFGAGADSKDGLQLIVAMEGTVKLRRMGWTASAPAAFGTALRRGDLLSLDGSSKATVACPDLTVRDLPPGRTSGAPCPPAQPELRYEGGLISPTRGGMSGAIPIVASPRKTKLLNTHPMLRWSPVAGAAGYSVSVRGPGVQWSAEVGADTKVAYPANAPRLAAGASYKVIVAAGSRSSSEDSEPGLGFTMLTADEELALRDAEKKIHALGLAAARAGFLTALLYAGRGLNAEAIEQLEELSPGFPEPAVFRACGDLYAKVALNNLAEERYQQALRLARRANDVEGQALAQSALGRMYQEAFDNQREARQRFQEAMTLYQRLGDETTVKWIRQRLLGP